MQFPNWLLNIQHDFSATLTKKKDNSIALNLIEESKWQDTIQFIVNTREGKEGLLYTAVRYLKSDFRLEYLPVQSKFKNKNKKI